jgi:outer membrane lipoprotein-sorting protein
VQRVLKPLVVGLVVLLAGGDALAATPPTSAEIIAGVKARYRGATSVRASFVQVVHNKALAQSSREQGRIALERPRKMRVDVGAQTILSDGTHLWFYDQKGKTLTQVPDAGGNGYAALLDDLGRLDEVFEVSVAAAPGARAARSWDLHLVPRTPGAFKSLDVRVGGGRYELEQLVITDPLDNVTELSFKGVRMDRDIPDSEFQPPAGARVLP